MKHPIATMIDELTKQATMKFREEDIARVKRTTGRLTRGFHITVECPLAVWDSNAMGVAFKRVKVETHGGKRLRMKRTASFILTQAEMENEVIISQKSSIALAAIEHNVMSSVRALKPQTEEKSDVGQQPEAA